MPGRTTEADIEEAIREAEEELSPKREEQIDQSRGSTGKRNVRVVKSESLSKPYEWRFVVVDVDTGEVLDNAQGYGYKTKQKAMAVWNYKTRDKSKDAAKAEKRKRAKKWLKDHPDIRLTLDDLAFQIVKRSWNPDGCINVQIVKDLVKENHLELDGLTAKDILRAWENG